jgi:hypothetical protein
MKFAYLLLLGSISVCEAMKIEKHHHSVSLGQDPKVPKAPGKKAL